MSGRLARQRTRLAGQLPDLPQLPGYQRAVWALRAALLQRATGVTVGSNVRVDRHFYYPDGLDLRFGAGVRIKRDVRAGWEREHGSDAALIIGARTEILAHVRLDCTGGIRIGMGSHIGRDCSIYTHRHAVQRRDVPVLEAPIDIAPVGIGDDVMIYSDVVVLPGITIGDGAVVAVRSVVTADVAPYAIVAGTPAKQTGQRD